MTPHVSARRRSGGFALLIVLWTLVLIAFLVAHLTASGHGEAQIAENLAANAVAQAAADGAIAEAIFHFTDPRPELRWPLDGSWHEVAIGNSRVAVRLEDEAARVNPNRAPPALLQALLVAAGSDEETARQLATAIGEWVGAVPNMPPSALLAEYRAAGRDYGPPGTPLESLDELRRVLGMTPALFAAIRPHLTLFGPPVPDIAHADPVVAAALARFSRSRSPPPVAPEAVRLARITALASGPGKARAMRAAVVTTGLGLPGGYLLLAFGSRVD
ncbi:MAG TPA: type II secretion system protein GspK [Stellaceae bacterium]|nr:type II secretion system protein GspK [Stellaceae bacterium]